MSAETSPILTDEQIEGQQAEYEMLRQRRDEAQARMDELNAALIASGEAKLRAACAHGYPPCHPPCDLPREAGGTGD